MRTVTEAGVQLVMNHFQDVLPHGSNRDSSETRSTASTGIEVCEEEMIAAANQLSVGGRSVSGNTSILASPSRLVLVGDSHMGKLSRA